MRLGALILVSSVGLVLPSSARAQRPASTLAPAPDASRADLAAPGDSVMRTASHVDTTSRVPRLRPTLTTMMFRSSAVSLASGGAASLVGMVVDQKRCEHHAARDPEWRAGSWFGPCFFETGAATAAAGIGGSIAGAAVVATRDARRRGCPAREALARAIAGAALGAIPSIAAAASGGGDDFPPGRTAAVVSAPLLSGVGASWLASRCVRR